MKLTRLIVIVLLMTQCPVFAQESFDLNGKTTAKGKAVENVHIINLATSIGTVTSDLGFFNISVKQGDTLLLSSLAHERLKIVIDDEIQKNKILTIKLTAKVVALDEMKLTGLTGNLEYDLQQQPEDSIPEVGWKYSVKALSSWVKPDNLSNQKSVNAEDFVNPIPGGGATIGLPNKRLIKERRQKRMLQLKKEFPDKLINEFGISYFTVTLGIAKEDIPNFISFCEPLNIFEKFRKNELLEVIDILKSESKNYHELED